MENIEDLDLKLKNLIKKNIVKKTTIIKEEFIDSGSFIMTQSLISSNSINKNKMKSKKIINSFLKLKFTLNEALILIGAYSMDTSYVLIKKIIELLNNMYKNYSIELSELETFIILSIYENENITTQKLLSLLINNNNNISEEALLIILNKLEGYYMIKHIDTSSWILIEEMKLI